MVGTNAARAASLSKERFSGNDGPWRLAVKLISAAPTWRVNPEVRDTTLLTNAPLGVVEHRRGGLPFRFVYQERAS